MTKQTRVKIWQIATILFVITFITGIVLNFVGSILTYISIGYILLAWIITYPSARKEQLQAYKEREDEQQKKIN